MPQVRIVEVGLRDGLQNESAILPTEVKREIAEGLIAAGVRDIEATSFVHPRWVPQLADAEELARRLPRVEGVRYRALVPNRKGLERALDTPIDEYAVFMSASETHNRKNINKGIDETFPVLEEAVRLARSRGKRVRGYVSTVFGCPYEGEVSVAQVAKVCERLFEMGVYEISLGDTIGVAHPRQVKEVLQQLLKQFPADRLAGHFHDTRGTALVNAYVALELGITTLDSSFGGLGGCPYAPGAAGNVATEDLVYMLEGMGGVDGDPNFVRPVPGQRPGSAADRPQASVQGVAEHPIKPAGKGRRRMNEVEWERMEGISVITLNRPEVYNALNFATLKELMKIVEELTHSKATRAVIITGAGEKAFCSGADLKERRTFTEDQVRRYIHLIRETFTAIDDCPGR